MNHILSLKQLLLLVSTQQVFFFRERARYSKRKITLLCYNERERRYVYNMYIKEKKKLEYKICFRRKSFFFFCCSRSLCYFIKILCIVSYKECVCVCVIERE